MREYPERPWVGIGVVVHKGHDILLIKRGKEPNKGQWSLPGGAQTLGETVFEGAYREVLEETGVTTQDHSFISVVDSIHKDDEGVVKYHYSLIEISCLFKSGKLLAQDDAQEAQWFPIKDIESLDLWQKTKEIIQQSYLSRKASFTEE